MSWPWAMRLQVQRWVSCGCRWGWGLAVGRVLANLRFRRKLLWCGVALGVGVSAFFLLLRAHASSSKMDLQAVETNFFHEWMQRYRKFPSSSSASNICSIPHYDPLDRTIRKFIFPYPPVACGWIQPYLTYMDSAGHIHINESGVLEAGLRKEDIECTYAAIYRRQFSDNGPDYKPQRVFRDGEKLEVPLVKVQCFRRSNGSLLYETVHTFVKPLSREQSKRVKPASALRPSVLIIMLDSMSRLNFIRQLPRTHAFITKDLEATVFTGLVKVADNTYPNILTMLTGMTAHPVSNIHVRAWNSDRFFDDTPIVWRNYSENGYITMFAEDMPDCSTFTCQGRLGFIKQPTDYDMRPVWQVIQNITTFNSFPKHCKGHIPSYEIYFNYTRDFVYKMRSRRYFAFSVLNDYSHDTINDVQMLDSPLTEFLTEIHRSGALNSTVLVVMGDHGNRLDPIRTTVVGRVEERMPYFALALPQDVRTARPHLQERLRGNRDTFISWYDVYETLADIALNNLQPTSRVTRWAELGYSLFRPVPVARSCAEAGVPQEYCVCAREVPLAVSVPGVEEAGRVLVEHVNALLVAGAGASACAPLTLVSVVNARLLFPADGVIVLQGFTVDIRVIVRVAPSDALLEGLVRQTAWEPDGWVEGDVQRINKYGNQSHCVRDRILRLYCFCTDLLPRTATPPPSA